MDLSQKRKDAFLALRNYLHGCMTMVRRMRIIDLVTDIQVSIIQGLLIQLLKWQTMLTVTGKI